MVDKIDIASSLARYKLLDWEGDSDQASRRSDNEDDDGEEGEEGSTVGIEEDDRDVGELSRKHEAK
jgi:hypothetical protein